MFLCRLDDVPDGGSRGFDPARTGQDACPLVDNNEIHLRET
jgi:hypothetical protein